MEDTIRVALARWRDRQPNMGSEAFRNNLAHEIALLLKEKGTYREYTKDELREQLDREMWVCNICGKSSYETEYDYLGSGTNHLGCELKVSEENNNYVYSGDIKEGMKRARELAQEGLEEGLRREKNSSQKKHEEKVFGHDQGGNYESTDTMTGHDHGNVWQGSDTIQKQVYMEMTSDGLPPGGDTQAVLESHKLADEIVDNQEGKWIYESPDGGKTVFRRPFGDYDMKNKEEINWETKEPTGRKFTDYPFKVNRGPDRRRAEK